MLGDDPFVGVLLAAADSTAWEVARAKLEALLDQAKFPESAVEIIAEHLHASSDLAGFVGRTLCALSTCAPGDAEVLRFEGLRELERERSSEDLLSPSYELHAHFRGSIPFDSLWRGWMTDSRSRAMCRKERLPCGTTRARRLEAARDARSKLGFGSRGGEKDIRKRIIADLLCAPPKAENDGIRYLLLLINTRRSFLVRRRHSGLAYFTSAYDRVSGASKRRWMRTDDRDRVREVCEAFETRGCVSLELRPTLKDTRRETQGALRSLVLGYLDYLEVSHNPLALGLVCSFFKQDGLLRHRAVHGSRDDAGLADRLNAQQRIWTRQAQALVAILEDVPAIRAFVVGVDAAGRERGAPTRFLAAPYSVLHDYNRRHNLGGRRGRGLDVSALQRRVKSGSPNAVWDQLNQSSPTSRLGCRVGVGFTVHAGEDFIDPVTGLREVWEAVTHLQLGRGDRIGHGLVLALRGDVLEGWMKARGAGAKRVEFRKPAGVHALDMAWAYGRVASSREAELELSRAVVDAVRGVPIPAFAHSPLASALPPACVPLGGVSFFEPDTPHASVMTRVVIDDEWKTGFEMLRKQVEDLVVRRGIVIESCPSSNCIVAGLDEPPLQSLLDNEALRVVVGTDDPGLLEAWPDDELRRLGGDGRRRVLEEAERASFIWRI